VCAIRELECRLLGDGLNPFSYSLIGFRIMGLLYGIFRRIRRGPVSAMEEGRGSRK